MSNRQWFYPTAFSAWGDEERAAVDRVLASGRLTMGPEVAAFEAELAEWHGVRHAVMVNSGSSANLVAVAALLEVGVIKRGDTVLVPALAWSTTYAPFVQLGLDLALVDCDPDTWCADFVSARFDPRDARLLLSVNILGGAADAARVLSVASVLGCEVVEDNCESLGARDAAGNLAGTAGLLSTTSFFWSHQVSAVEGGAVLTDDDLVARMARMLRAHGWTRDVEPAADFDHEYDFRVMGYNLRPLEMHAAVAREQLRKQAAHNEVRVANLRCFQRMVSKGDLPVRLQLHDGSPSPFGMAFTVEDPDVRRRLASVLRAAGIDCRPPTGGSLRLHPYGARWAGQATPEADRVHTCGMFLGNGPVDLSEQVARAVDVMAEVLR